MAQLIWLQALPLVLAMSMLQLHLTARLWQQPCHQLDVFCWQGPLGRAASKDLLTALTEQQRQGPAGLRRQ